MSLGQLDIEARTARIYDAIIEDEDARVCTEIDERACTNLPVNFVLLVVSNLLTKIGDALANPKTVLPWVMTATQAPVSLVALLVPIRESGSLLPQLLIAGFIRRMPKRKPAWILGCLVQAASIGGIGVVAFTLTGAAAGWTIVGCLTLFSLGRGVCSVSHKDVLGKTIPKRRRGRVSGISAALSGLAATAVGLYFLFARGQEDAAFYGALVVAAGAAWLAGAAVFTGVRESPGETDGGANAIGEALRQLSLLRDDAPFRRFVIARTLALCSALSAPYYVVLGKQAGTGGAYLLGAFILADGLAASFSSPVWGRLSDVSSRSVLAVALAGASALGVAVFAIDLLDAPAARWPWTYPIAFFFLGICHSGVRLGRKTYVVDLAGGNKRTDYVAVSNTVIGVALLAVGGIGASATFATPAQIILALSAMGAAGAVLARTLPDAQ